MRKSREHPLTTIRRRVYFFSEETKEIWHGAYMSDCTMTLRARTGIGVSPFSLMDAISVKPPRTSLSKNSKQASLGAPPGFIFGRF